MEEAQQRAKLHINFSTNVYRAQMRAGRYFIHEHPQSASRWKLASIQELADSPMVVKAYGNIYAFGMMSKDKDGPEQVLKPTVFSTRERASSEVQGLQQARPPHGRRGQCRASLPARAGLTRRT